MLHYRLDQDIFDSNAQTLVNPVNCIGIMGKGLALQFKKRYGLKYFAEYQQSCRYELLHIGHPTLFVVNKDRWILNFPTKLHWRNPSKLEFIEQGLAYFIHNYQKAGITGVAFPKLGCANGGLLWSEVGPLMAAYLGDLPIDVYVYIHTGDQEYH